MLEVNNLTVQYDGAMALNDVSIKVEKGEFVSVVGQTALENQHYLKRYRNTGAVPKGKERTRNGYWYNSLRKREN